MAHIGSPFRMIYALGHGSGLAFEAEFTLPTDDCPGSVNKLVMRVEMDSTIDVFCAVAIVNRTATSERTIMRGEAVPIESISNMLYGFARLRQKPVLEFVS